MLNDFLEYLNKIRKYSNNTIINYEFDINLFNEFLSKKKLSFKNVEYKDILEFVNYLKDSYKSTSINRILSSLRTYYNYLLKNNLVKSNPFNVINSLKKEKKLPEYFKYNEYIELIDSIDVSNNLGIRNKCLFEILLCTGCRVNELVNIKLNDIDINLREIKVLGKGKKERIVYIGSYAIDSLKEYLNIRDFLLKNKNNNYLFLNHLGNKLTTRGIRDIIDKILLNSSLKLKITPHTFRHSFATMLLKEGCDLKSVQELLGHVSLSTTSIYTHITNEELKRVYLKTNPRQIKWIRIYL